MIEKQDPCCLKDTTHPPTTVLIYIHVYNSLYIHNHSREQTNQLKMPKWTRDTKIILIFWNRALVEIQSNYQDCGCISSYAAHGQGSVVDRDTCMFVYRLLLRPGSTLSVNSLIKLITSYSNKDSPSILRPRVRAI